MEKHNAEVARIASEVQGFHYRKEQFRIYHGSTNSTRASNRRRDQIVDTSALNQVVRIDKERKRAFVEPKVRMDELVHATLPFNLVPPVVMEFPAITAGGGFAGMGCESSSFKYGLFDATILSIEVILADGTVVNASATEKSDLFFGAARTCGSLGIVTLLEVRLIQAKPYVELTYHPVTSIDAAVELCHSFTKDEGHVDFVEGIIYSPERGAIITGTFADSKTKGSKVRRFTRARDQWFYIHAERQVRNRTTPVTELVPIVDYLFRYDRGAFWTGKVGFDYFSVRCDRLSRLALNRLLHTETMYRALHYSELDQKVILQDYVLPYSTSNGFIQYVNQTCKIFPLWLCPIKPPAPQSSTMYKHPFSEDMLLNIGVWGPGPKERDAFVQLHRDIEHKVNSLHGIKWPYSHSYWTEAEFWGFYNQDAYGELRAKWNAALLPSMYDKLKADPAPAAESKNDNPNRSRIVNRVWNIWPVPGLYGVLKVLVGADYLLRKPKA